MPTLTPTTDWLNEAPVLFFRELDLSTDSVQKDATWRFTKVKNRPRTIPQLRARLQKDFEDAPAQVRNAAKQAWQESDDTLVIGKICDVLDALRDNFAQFSGPSKAWIMAYKNKRGIKRKLEE